MFWAPGAAGRWELGREQGELGREPFLRGLLTPHNPHPDTPCWGQTPASLRLPGPDDPRPGWGAIHIR